MAREKGWVPCSGFMLAMVLLPLSVVFATPAPIEVRVVPRWQGEAAQPSRLTLVAVPTEALDEYSAVEVIHEGAGPAALPLSNGKTFRVTAANAGVWSPGTLVVAKPGASVHLDVYPTGSWTGTLVGEVSLADAPANALTALFRTAGASPGRAPVEDKVPCTLAESGDDDRRRTFSCAVPALALDARLRLPGFVSHYLWARTVAAGERQALGDLRLRRGASIVGWVETVDGPLDPERCSVVALPAIAHVGSPSREREARRARNDGAERDEPYRVTPNAHGFFHIEGLPEGGYTLEARHDGYTPTEVGGIVLRPNVEATLEVPLVLDRPLTLEVMVAPERSPTGHPWRVTQVMPERRTLVPRDGRWRATGARPGPAMIAVADEDGTVVEQVELHLDRDTGPLLVEVAMIDVAGQVWLGDEPLPAQLTFTGGEGGFVRVPFEADDEGIFAGWLPREGQWNVSIEATAPRVSRRLRGVEVESDASGGATVEIRLPDTRITGRGVDETGQPVADARVLLFPVTQPEMPLTATTGEDGTFSFEGVSVGEHQIEAEGFVDGVTVTSGTEVLRIADTEDTASIELTLLPRSVLRGRVVGPHGRPVAHARVTASAQTGSVPKSAVRPRTHTDGRGAFDLELVPGLHAVELNVLAPGYALFVGAFDVAPGQDLVVPLSDQGGTLRLGWGGPRTFSLDTPSIRLTYQGRHRLSTPALAQWSRAHGEDPGWMQTAGYTLPMMPPGRYRLCLGGGDDPEASQVCDEADLTVGGMTELTVSAEGAKAPEVDSATTIKEKS